MCIRDRLITILAIIVSSIVAFFAFKFSKPSNKNSKLSYNDKVYLHANLELELNKNDISNSCLLYTSPSPRDRTRSRMPSSA